MGCAARPGLDAARDRGARARSVRLRGVCRSGKIGYSSDRTPGCDADVAQLVEHHLAKVRVAGSNPVVRSEGSVCPCGMPFAAEWPSGLGKGLQSPVHGFDSRLRLYDSSERQAARSAQTVPLTGSSSRRIEKALDPAEPLGQ